MKTVFNWAGIAIAVSALAACGGGGGSAPVPVALVVKVNGTERAADASRQVAVAPGDQVEVVSSQPVNWSGAAAKGSSITVRNPTTAGTTWAGQIVNEKAEAGSYALNGVSTADASVQTSLLLTVKAGDSRNGSYEVFASNGTRQKLALNFDVKTYEMNDPANATVSASGSIAANVSEAGTWDFVAPRGTAATTARFRMTADTVVGSFPFANQYSSFGRDERGTYSIKPFVASRALRTNQALIDGVYIPFGVALSSDYYQNYRALINVQMEISAAGTKMQTCAAVTPMIAECPASFLKTFNITQGGAPDQWKLTDVASGVNGGLFSVANVAGENLYLSAGNSPTIAGMQIFEMGVISRSFSNFTSHGGSTEGSWEFNNINIGSSDNGSWNVSRITKDASAYDSNNFPGWVNRSKVNAIAYGTRGVGYSLARSERIGVIGGLDLYTFGFLQFGLLD